MGKDFGLPVGDETTNIMQERRENLISKLRSYGTTTKKMIVRWECFYKWDVQVVEHNEKYLFEIFLHRIIGIPPNMDDFRQTIEIIKPAHLTYEIRE